jgi:hypothetical protein
MLIAILEKINNFNELIFAPIDNFIDKLPIDELLQDALVDSVHLVPFLFFIFIFIEILEFYFSDRINSWIIKSKKEAPLAGAVSSIFPQCGFSVIASSLYSNKMLTKGTLLAVYLGTSDESIPILLAYPQKAYLIIPIVVTKLIIAIFIGYFVDLVFDKNKQIVQIDKSIVNNEGCCKHDIDSDNKRELILHPFFHTLNTFVYILLITICLNYILANLSIAETIENVPQVLQCGAITLIGLIPNCAISIAITMMLIKGTITFGAAIGGLLSNAGLGLLVLLKNNKFADTMKILVILLVASFVSGILIDLFLNFCK